MREKNPDMVAGEKRKFVMKPPQVVRVGTKKTSFVNFTDICKLWASCTLTPLTVCQSSSLWYSPKVFKRVIYELTNYVLHHRLHRQPKHLLAFLLAELGTRYVFCNYNYKFYGLSNWILCEFQAPLLKWNETFLCALLRKFELCFCFVPFFC